MSAHLAIVDYGLGNLLSVKLASEHAGLRATITSSAKEISAADAMILPGVGAFGNAMDEIRRLGLTSVIRDFAASGKPLMGICLGMQLLMGESEEFGRHEGLNLIEGRVVRLGSSDTKSGAKLKIPHLGWNKIHKVPGRPAEILGEDGVFMYFVHSYHVVPADPGKTICVTRYGHQEFASGIRSANVWGFQFHPERSGPQGLAIYRKFAELVGTGRAGMSKVLS